ncbi:hypothetical protein NDU88_005385 [Pleurodeles waltl]|uniref:Uncharacterized protein n=1 Tax=Pleurodeles waltl TaxID=8319 RepID=A0AAV7NWI1_PLEWA|nr:hypothetical protein NDU88_005385 [Pleurodeles waltl]
MGRGGVRDDTCCAFVEPLSAPCKLAWREVRALRLHRDSIYVAAERTIMYGANPVWVLGARQGALRPAFPGPHWPTGSRNHPMPRPRVASSSSCVCGPQSRKARRPGTSGTQ